MPIHSGKLTVQSEVQGKVYHWTISTGFSLAEATNMFVGRREHLVHCTQDWLHLMEQCCKQVQWGAGCLTDCPAAMHVQHSRHLLHSSQHLVMH